MSIKVFIKAKKLIKKLTCPTATQDLELNTVNRNAAIEAEHIQYGPINLEDQGYWDKLADHWNTTPEVAKESNCSNCAAFDISPRMKECMPGSLQEDGELGYCWMHHFKCHSARTCYTWAAGGPISDDKISEEWQEKNKESLDEKKKKSKKKKSKKKKSKKKKGDRCTRIAKRKYDVWPSAYASGAVVKCRQGKIWKGLKESELNDIIEEEITKAITKVLRDEGGAAGMDALVKGTEASEEEIEDAIEAEEKFIKHTDGDIILKDDSLDEKKKKKKAGTESSKESSLRDWFGRKGAKGKSSGWVDCNTCRKDKKTGRKTCKSCGRKKGEKRAKYPSCRPTPGACGEKGRGKSWGKKSAKGKK